MNFQGTQEDIVVVLLRLPEQFFGSKHLRSVQKVQKNGKYQQAANTAAIVRKAGESFDFSLWTPSDASQHYGLFRLVMRKDVAKLQSLWFKFLLVCAADAQVTLKILRPFFVRTSDKRAVRRLKHLLCRCSEREALQASDAFDALIACAQQAVVETMASGAKSSSASKVSATTLEPIAEEEEK